MTRAVTFTAALLVVTGCGGAPESAATDARGATPTPAAEAMPSRAPVDACAVLTADEVGEILGTAATGQKDDATGFDAACTWTTPDAAGSSREVSVEIGRLDAASIVEEYQTFTKTLPFRENVQGIGDAAFLAGYGVSGAALVMRSGTALVFLNTTVSGQDATLRRLGPSVLARVAGSR